MANLILWQTYWGWAVLTHRPEIRRIQAALENAMILSMTASMYEQGNFHVLPAPAKRERKCVAPIQYSKEVQ